LLPRNAVCEFKSSTRFVQPNSNVIRNEYLGAQADSAAISRKTFCEQPHSTENSEEPANPQQVSYN
jgi:hypothetical protein